jgi:hypothetical protein
LDHPIPAFAVAAYLESLPGTEQVRPVEVTIARETFLGAVYVQDRPYEAGMGAVARGKKAAGDPHYSRRFYLLGELPLAYRKAGKDRRGEAKLVFVWEAEDWYVAGGYTPHLLKPWKAPADFRNVFGGGDLRPCNPFGHWFGLHCWPTNERTPDGDLIGPIDRYDEQKRKRERLVVTFLEHHPGVIRCKSA